MPSNNNTPTTRNLRSNSQTDLTINNIKVLIDASKNEIISCMRSEIQILKESISSLTSRVEKLEEENANLKKKNERFLNQSHSEPSSVENLCSEMMDEMQQRERRKLNLVIVGAPEPSTGSVAERRTADKEQCSELFSTIGLSQCNIKDVSRIGKITPERRRLLRVTMCHEEDKRYLIAHSKHLRQVAKFKKMYT